LADQPPIYCIDSGSLFDLKQRNPPDLFPGPWAKLAELGRSRRLIAPREVRREIEAGDDEVVEWALHNANLFRDPDDAQLEIVREILREFPRFVDLGKERADADVFIVAVALLINRSQPSSIFPQVSPMFPQRCIVVSEERPRRAPTGPPKIPDVCAHYGIECIKLFTLMRNEGWTF